MEAKAEIYISLIFRSFQGFQVEDIKEFQSNKEMKIILKASEGKDHFCTVCGSKFGTQDGGYGVRARHMQMMDWSVFVEFRREKKHCPRCNKIRSEKIDFISDSTPHVTKDLAWWINRLTEITSVLAVSKLESVDKQTCYNIDHDILTKMLQGYGYKNMQYFKLKIMQKVGYPIAVLTP